MPGDRWLRENGFVLCETAALKWSILQSSTESIRSDAVRMSLAPFPIAAALSELLSTFERNLQPVSSSFTIKIQQYYHYTISKNRLARIQMNPSGLETIHLESANS